MSKRIEYIDIARGVGILLVVLGHNDLSLSSPFLYQFIYSFHMALFFFLSGFFFSAALPFWELLKKRFNSLLKPYFFTIFLIYFVSVSFGKMSFNTAIGRILKSLYAGGIYIDWIQLWFLPHLFAVSVFAFIVLRFGAIVLKNRFFRWAFLIAMLALGVWTSGWLWPFSIHVFGKSYTLYGLPLNLDLILVSGFFFILGSEIRQIAAEKWFENWLMLFGAGTSLVILNILFKDRVDMATRVYDSFLVNTTEAILGIFFILSLARQIELHSTKLALVLKYVGQISLIILIFHVPIQDFWGQKIMTATGSTLLFVAGGFFMGVTGSVLIYELFIKANPVASFWFGRTAEMPRQKRES